jgi:hypothetical protein
MREIWCQTSDFRPRPRASLRLAASPNSLLD